MPDNMMWLSPTMSAWLHCRALIGTYVRTYRRALLLHAGRCAVLEVDARQHASSTHVGAGCAFLCVEQKELVQK